MKTTSGLIESVGTVRDVSSSGWASDNLPNLDYLRAVAVLLVFLGHLTYFLGFTDVGRLRIYWMGRLGVYFFFVHTCLVLMLSLERQWKKQGSLDFTARFMIRRIFRIYPLSIAVVVLIIAFRLPQAGVHPGHFTGISTGKVMIVSNLLLVQSARQSIIGPLWSLPYEMAMYLFLPWLFLFLYPDRSLWRVAAVWLLSLLGCTAFLYHAGWLAGDNFLLFVPCFLPGVAAYQLQRTRRRQFPAYLWLGLVITAVLLFLFNQGIVSNHRFKAWFVCGMLGLAAPFFAQTSSPWVTVPAHFIAKYSYGIYLTHFFCIWLIFERLHLSSGTLRVGIFVVLVVGLPVLLYRFLEEPLIRLGRRVATGFRI